MVDTLYLVHHSHTDVGYTHDQPVLWELQSRFLDDVLNLAEEDLDLATDHAFHWTVEATSVLDVWLKSASSDQIERLLNLVRLGRIEVTGMPFNITPLFDRTQFIESLQGIARLRTDFGIPIRHAMNCDVNGQNWSVADALLDAGITSFSMAINTHFGGFPFHRPYPFWWVAPSGRKLFTLNGFHYFAGWRFGIGRDADDFERFWWPTLSSWLEKRHYPFTSLMIQTIHPFGDNGTGYAEYSRFIQEWNRSGKLPRLVFSTPSRWVDAIRSELENIPEHHGDWTDFWNFGCGSSAREVRINRESRTRLIAADTLSAFGNRMDSKVASDLRHERLRKRAWHFANLFDEHTWGVDFSARHPENDDSVAQWNHKANYAYRSRSLSTLLQRDALAEVTSLFLHEDADRFVIFNPLPWPRTLAGPVSSHTVHPRGTPEDETAGRHFQDHGETNTFPTNGFFERTPADCFCLPPTEVPGLGVSILERKNLLSWQEHCSETVSDAVENHRFRLTFGSDAGQLNSVWDKHLDRNWILPDGAFGINQLVHEKVDPEVKGWKRSELFETDWGARSIEMPDGWKPDWPAIRNHEVSCSWSRNYSSLLGTYRVSHFRHAELDSIVRECIFLPDYAEWIEFETSWIMGSSPEPEATYLAFRFNLGDPVVRFDAGGQCVRIEHDQLPGSCRDYFTTQNWVDFCDGKFGVTIATPENPMFQLGDFNFAKHLRDVGQSHPLFLGWITNNYWETNFRAHQPGKVSARYRIYPYAGDFREARAIRFGLEASNARLLVQHGGEKSHNVLPRRDPGPFIRFQVSEDAHHPVFPIQMKQGSGREILVRLYNASDENQDTYLKSGLLSIENAREADFFGKPVRDLEGTNDEFHLSLKPRETKTILLTA